MKLTLGVSGVFRYKVFTVNRLASDLSLSPWGRGSIDASRLELGCERPRLRVGFSPSNHVTNVSVRSQTNQPPVSSLIQQRHLKLFGHIARAAASEDHSRALRASTDHLPIDWRRPRGRPRQSWLRTIESDLKPLNLGLHSALRRTTDRPSWRRIV